MLPTEEDADQFVEHSPVPGLSWDDLDKIAGLLTKMPLGESGYILNREQIGFIVGTLLRHGYTIMKVGPT